LVLLIVVGWFVLPESRDPNPGPWDLIGAVLSLVGVIGVVYAIKEFAAKRLRADCRSSRGDRLARWPVRASPTAGCRFRWVDVRLFAQNRFHRPGALDPAGDAGAVRGGVLFSSSSKLVQGSDIGGRAARNCR